jgi:hypothetical protein
MARRSTRNKLRWSVGQAAHYVEKTLLCLRYADALQEGRHPRVEAALPAIVEALVAVESTLKRLRQLM